MNDHFQPSVSVKLSVLIKLLLSCFLVIVQKDTATLNEYWVSIHPSIRTRLLESDFIRTLFLYWSILFGK